MAGERNNAVVNVDIKLKGALVVVDERALPIAMLVPNDDHDDDDDDDQIINESSYGECMRNHAAPYGRHAVDGCGEFIFSINEPHTCAACGCHRSYHRKEAPDAAPAVPAAAAAAAVVRPAPAPVAAAPVPAGGRVLSPMPLAAHNGVTGETSVYVRDRKINIIGAGGSTSSEGAAAAAAGPAGVLLGKEKDKVKDEGEYEDKRMRAKAMMMMMRRKRAKRTMLSKEQKAEMTVFADKIGWRSRRQDAAEIHRFCDGIGITKRCFVIWLNNNKRGRNKNNNGSGSTSSSA